MTRSRWSARWLWLGCAVALAAPAPGRPRPPGLPLSIDLSAPFGARPGWRFTTSQGPAVPDPVGGDDATAPGAIRLCISRDGGRTCRPGLDRLLVVSDGTSDFFSDPHFLDEARLVRTPSGVPLLLIEAASLHSGDGDQRVATVALAYHPAEDAFVPAFEKRTGRNNNQEIRYVATGRLRGAIISAEPTDDAPFGFWMTVSRIGPGNRYRPVLRYRSATRYGDGNPLAVIDSEMPNLQHRLGLWRPGSPPPLPTGGCARPRLTGWELWCSATPAQ